MSKVSADSYSKQFERQHLLKSSKENFAVVSPQDLEEFPFDQIEDKLQMRRDFKARNNKLSSDLRGLSKDASEELEQAQMFKEFSERPTKKNEKPLETKKKRSDLREGVPSD